MCGIFGVFLLEDEVINEKDIRDVKKLGEYLSHRGPDGQSIVKIDDYALVGHNRLAINDIENGEQPFVYDKNIIVSVNGEIYNYRELVTKEGLKKLLRTKSDSEVVIPLYNRYSLESFKKLEGMYALSILDKYNKVLVLARDYFGEKPLYYIERNRRIYYSSEAKALIKLFQIRIEEFGKKFFIDYIKYGYCMPNEDFPVSEVKRGTTHVFNRQGSMRTYNQSRNKTREYSKNEIFEEIESYIDNACISDVPITCGLSGGLDSSYILNQIKDKVDSTYTVNYESTGGVDEAEEARRISKYYGVENRRITILDRDVSSLFKNQVQRKDLPISDIAGIGYYALYREVSRDKYKVIVMGHGGDEIFMGYPWLFESLKYNKKNNMNLLYETLSDYRVYRKLIKMVYAKSFLNINAEWEHMYFSHNRDSAYHRTFEAVNECWLDPNSLRMADSLSMSLGLESRQPLLNMKIVEQMAYKEEEMVCGKSKEILRKHMLKTIPQQLVQKKKKYFTPPLIKFYDLIHKSINNNGSRILGESGIFDQRVLEHVIYGRFNKSSLTYYLFPRLATLHYWIESLTQ